MKTKFINKFYFYFLLLALGLTPWLQSCVSSDDNPTDLQLATNGLVSSSSSDEEESSEDPHLSSLSFSGISSVDELSPTRVQLNWSLLEGAYAYQIFKVDVSDDGSETLEYLATAAADETSYIVEDLTAETNYKFRIRTVDSEGRIDSNTLTTEVTTDAYEEWSNARSLNFTGSEYVSVGTSKSIINESSFSVSLWFKTTTSGTSQNGNYLLSSFTYYTETFTFGIGFNRTNLLVKMRNSAGTIEYIAKAMSYGDGSWHHVVASYDGSTLNFYVDGTLAGTKTITFLGLGTKPLLIGALKTTSYFYKGQVDEVAFFDTALSESEVTELMSGGATQDPNRHSRFTNMTHWYRFESPDDVSTVTDLISGGVNGTPVNILEDSYQSDAP